MHRSYWVSGGYKVGLPDKAGKLDSVSEASCLIGAVFVGERGRDPPLIAALVSSA